MEIAQSIKSHNISMSENAPERDNLIETLLHHLYDYYVPFNEMTAADYFCYLRINEVLIEYLNQYLLEEINP